MKTKFELDVMDKFGTKMPAMKGEVEIIGEAPKDLPYFSISMGNLRGFVKDKELKKMAINILKCLSKKP